MTSRKTRLSREQRRAVFQTMVADLQAQRDELRARLEEIEQELVRYGVRTTPARKPGATRRGRATRTREGSLKGVILQVLGKEGMTGPEIAKAVRPAESNATPRP